MTTLCREKNSFFLGQSLFEGNAICETLKEIPKEKRLELPVFEDTQMGMSIGLALSGLFPISIFPRFDFLLLATNQLVNHLDKLPLIAGVRPKLIIRTVVGATAPLNPGPQHSTDYTEAFRKMLQTVVVEEIDSAETAYDKYMAARDRDTSTLIIERGNLYNA